MVGKGGEKKQRWHTQLFWKPRQGELRPLARINPLQFHYSSSPNPEPDCGALGNSTAQLGVREGLEKEGLERNVSHLLENCANQKYSFPIISTWQLILKCADPLLTS